MGNMLKKPNVFAEHTIFTESTQVTDGRNFCIAIFC